MNTREPLTNISRVLASLFCVALLIAAMPVEAKRIIQGQVKDETNKPMKGLLVKAWDSDSASDNDFMGQAYTDANGRYRIEYRGGHWDPYPHNITKWRPDIFVKVLVNADGYWVKTAKSKTYTDHKLAEDLTINLTVPRNEEIIRFTDFNPKYHALPFRNHTRTVCAAPTCQDEHAGKLALAALAVDPSGITSATIKLLQEFSQFNWALCGGLSLTALQDFREGRKPQPFSPKLKERLVANQLKTLAPSTWAKFIQWQAKPTEPHTMSQHTIGYSTKGEWPKVKQAIDAKAPIILGLIRVQNATGREVSDNHQALAVGYAYNRLTTKVVIYLYDPNFCMKQLGSDCYSDEGYSTLTFYTGVPQSQIHAVYKKPGDGLVKPNTRGFFAISEGSGRPTRPVYNPDRSSSSVGTMAAKAPSAKINASRVFRMRGADPEEATVVVNDAEADDEEIQAYEEALAEWRAEEDNEAALALLERIAAARSAEVTTRGESGDASEQVRRLIAPDQFEDPLAVD